MKRLLQYSCLCAHFSGETKNNHTLFRQLTPRSRAHLISSLASSPSLLLSSLGPYHPRRYALALVSASASRISYLARCFSRALYLWLTCILYMYSPYLASTTVHASLLYLYTSHLVLRVSMHLLHIIHYTTALYLYSVLLGRASSAVVLQRLPNIRCLSCLLCTCSTSSRTGYESESPTNSGVIEDTRNSTCAVYLWRI